jgi:hypothetical protein
MNWQHGGEMSAASFVSLRMGESCDNRRMFQAARWCGHSASRRNLFIDYLY